MNSYFNKTYKANSFYWLKWRRAFEAGDQFILHYLKRFSTRETQQNFNARRAISYCPAFAKEAIVDIRNSIFQRMVEVQRFGPESYLRACAGEDGGVDLASTSMTQYMGSVVLDELLVMGKVAIWVDGGKLTEDGVPTKLSKQKPYLYLYTVEEICGWDDEENPTSILLKDLDVCYDEVFGLQKPPEAVYRHARVVDGKVVVTMLKGDKTIVGEPEILDFDRLPLVILTIKESLMKDICNYQIALMNLASSNISCALRSNFPIYTEQYDTKADIMRKFSAESATEATVNEIQGTAVSGIDVGASSGIRYPIGTASPGFINPDPDPLRVSMEIQEQLKQEIRTLVNLSLSNMSPTRSSSDSKKHDEKGLESGLAYIAQELERAEKIIVALWQEYTGTNDNIGVVYPTDYSLKPDEVRQKEASDSIEFAKKLPSKTAQRELVKLAIEKVFGGKLSSQALSVIRDEIDEAQILYVDPDTLFKDLEAHLVSNEYASELRGYPIGESEKAIIDHTDKLARIATAQSDAAIIGRNQDAPGVPTLKTEREKKDGDS